jgi:hypothetical protein
MSNSIRKKTTTKKFVSQFADLKQKNTLSGGYFFTVFVSFPQYTTKALCYSLKQMYNKDGENSTFQSRLVSYPLSIRKE